MFFMVKYLKYLFYKILFYKYFCFKKQHKCNKINRFIVKVIKYFNINILIIKFNQ